LKMIAGIGFPCAGQSYAFWPFRNSFSVL